MKAVFSVVSLLVVLAVIGVLASRQLKASRELSVPSAGPAASAFQTSPGATAAEQSRQIQQQVRDEVQRSMEQSAERVRQAEQ